MQFFKASLNLLIILKTIAIVYQLSIIKNCIINFSVNGAEKKVKRDKSYLVVRAGQAGAELKSVGLANEGSNHQVSQF